MNRNAAKLRAIAAQACQNRNFSFKALMGKHGLEDVLLQANERNLNAKELAVTAIYTCCCDDGKWNNCTVMFLAVMQFINENLGDPGTQAFHDLAAILKTGATLDTVQKWADSHFQ